MPRRLICHWQEGCRFAAFSRSVLRRCSSATRLVRIRHASASGRQRHCRLPPQYTGCLHTTPLLSAHFRARPSRGRAIFSDRPSFWVMLCRACCSHEAGRSRRRHYRLITGRLITQDRRQFRLMRVISRTGSFSSAAFALRLRRWLPPRRPSFYRARRDTYDFAAFGGFGALALADSDTSAADGRRRYFVADGALTSVHISTRRKISPCPAKARCLDVSLRPRARRRPPMATRRISFPAAGFARFHFAADAKIRLREYAAVPAEVD